MKLYSLLQYHLINCLIIASLPKQLYDRDVEIFLRFVSVKKNNK